MREIKFRGKKKSDKKWINGDLNHLNDKIFIFNREDDEDNLNSPDDYEVIPETIGMKAIINGVEVYEGDLHKTEPVDVDGEMTSSYLPIVFDNGAFWLDESFKKDGSLLTLVCEYDEPLNIVGNIHDNPQLL